MGAGVANRVQAFDGKSLVLGLGFPRPTVHGPEKIPEKLARGLQRPGIPESLPAFQGDCERPVPKAAPGMAKSGADFLCSPLVHMVFTCDAIRRPAPVNLER
jgi:hypothetical protein